MEKQRLLYQQSRLHNRGAAEMVLQMISACKGSGHTDRTDVADSRWSAQQLWTSEFSIFSHISGEPGAMLSSTLKLGISILNGGNSDVQQVRVSPKYLGRALSVMMDNT